MGNSASFNETINARLSQLEALDINFSKSFTKNSSNSQNKCSACQATFNFISFKRRKCINCIEYYCSDCVTHYKDNIYICYRCQTFISPDFGWSELMKLKSKDLIWYLNRKNISCPNCKEKEQLVEIILEKFRVSSGANISTNFQRPLINMERTENAAPPGGNSSPNKALGNDLINSELEPTTEANPPHTERPSSSNQSDLELCRRRAPPPTYDEAMEGGYSCSPIKKDERVPIEDIVAISDFELLSVKQLKDMLAYNKVDYKGCVERHELISRVERLWTAYNSDRICSLVDSSDQVPPVKECIICMDNPVDCVLIECGHMLCCVRCGSRLAECPVCRQNVVRCIRVFPVQ